MRQKWLIVFCVVLPCMVFARDVDVTVKTNNATQDQGASHILVVAGTPYDFTSVLTCWEKAQNAKKQYPGSAYTLDATTEFGKYSTYCVNGKILQVLPDGLIVDCSEATWSSAYETVFVRDYPEKDAVVDGDPIKTFGMPTGKYQYTAVGGALRTIREFTCARKPLRTYTSAEVKKLAVDKDEKTTK